MSRLDWGLIGGGEGSQVGILHRTASGLDRHFELRAAALDIDPQRSRQYGKALGLSPDRAYGHWQEMLESERRRQDRLSLVTVATPNDSHHPICTAFLEAGFSVLCEKPLTILPADARSLLTASRRSDGLTAVNYGYSGYPMIRQFREIVTTGQLGRIRLVVAEFAGGFLADVDDVARVAWRFDPERSGLSGITQDCGTHALHLACYVTDQKITSVLSDFVHGIAGRPLEDDSLTAFRMSEGTAGRLWSSGLAIGRTHGLTLQAFGEKGGLRWWQESPDQLQLTPLKEPTRILERGSPYLAERTQYSSRITIGHPEGLIAAFANIYKDLAYAINTGRKQHDAPSFADGAHMVAVTRAIVDSARSGGQWVSVID